MGDAPNRRLTAALLVLLIAPALAPAATTYRVDVPSTLARQIDAAKAKTDVPILLPSRLISFKKRLFGSGGATDDGYSFDLAYTRGCGGANVCDTATFYAERGKEPDYKRRATLADGITGYYKPLTCGASCAAPEIQWLADGILYSIQAEAGSKRVERRRMIRLAKLGDPERPTLSAGRSGASFPTS